MVWEKDLTPADMINYAVVNDNEWEVKNEN